MAKRQLGLAEAFLHAAPAPAGAARPAKRARSTASSSPPPSTVAADSNAQLNANKAPKLADDRTRELEAVAPATSFSAADWRASLATTPANSSSPSEADLLALESHTLHPSWLEHLRDELREAYFLELKRFLWSEGLKGTQDRQGGKLKVFPPARDVYAWSRYTPLRDVKVVILGQDPYHDDGQAHGLCFSVRPGVKIPPSLRNIYKEIKEEYPEFEMPKHGTLTSLARSGVLLLNTSLTVAPHRAGSHSNRGWETFTDKVIDLVDRYGGHRPVDAAGGGGGEDGEKGSGVVVLAWGAWAAKRVAKMDKHPSPLSARRGFFGNGHFRRANEWLMQKYGPDVKIDWTKLEPEADEAALPES
ncbi:uracil DNA glycosylase [Rhodotorula sphaerocarpa]